MSSGRSTGLWSAVFVWTFLIATVGVAASPSEAPQRELGSTVGLSSAATANDCPAGEVYDDGVAENGYSGNPASIETFEAVQKFTPGNYPVRYIDVCLALTALGASDLEFEITVYDDDGADGGPGTFLGSVAASATELPNGVPCTFYSYKIGSLKRRVTSGSVYLGVRWNPMTHPSRFICSDESTETTLHPSFVNFNQGTGWQPTESVFPSYRALQIRAISKIVKKVRLRAKPATVASGQRVRLIAKVTPCIPGHRHKVKLQYKKGGWKGAGTKRTSGPKCRAIFKKTLSKTTRFRAKSPGNAKYLPAISNRVRVRAT